jgi:DnaJ-class molecular chaperone|tara:strand:+ start:1664 stop:1975 length:312 start_codon:yes stop_codon:yes gene_type:complete
MKTEEILEDNFGDQWVTLEGEIKVGDYAYNHDTGDVIYIEEDDDLYFRNETCQRVEEHKEVCETCGGDGEIWHSDYYCDMAYSTPCPECCDDSDFEYELLNNK